MPSQARIASALNATLKNTSQQQSKNLTPFPLNPSPKIDPKKIKAPPQEYLDRSEERFNESKMLSLVSLDVPTVILLEHLAVLIPVHAILVGRH